MSPKPALKTGSTTPATAKPSQRGEKPPLSSSRGSDGKKKKAIKKVKKADTGYDSFEAGIDEAAEEMEGLSEDMHAVAPKAAAPTADMEPAVEIEGDTTNATATAPAADAEGAAPDIEVQKTYSAFISHYKMEAAMEARYLQSELEAQLGRRAFLDSDDLHDLRLLKDAVVQSDALVLLQSARVLERPWCLIELATALDCGIPIVGVSLTSGNSPYSFADSTVFLKSLGTSLAERNPGAPAVLLENDIDIDDLAWKLSVTLPHIISIGFNPSASKNVLSAILKDITTAMSRATTIELQPKAEWLSRTASATPAAPAAPTPRAAADAAANATIPPEVPELPAALQPRPELLAELKAKVLRPEGGTASLVGVRKAATMAARGMGGTGKTTAAAALVRDAEVSRAFSRVLWVSVSAEPDPLSLLRLLYFQLTSTKLPSHVETERDAAQILREAATGVKALLVLDDVWEAKHAELLNCTDVGAGSACVITTRIRDLTASEVSCGLLSQEEALALLLTSAGLDHLIAEPPAAALEAVECCGRLALALPIAGGMVRELEDVWETELVPMLKEELSEELSVEARIVNASLRCVKPSERAGVEALFLVFGCFAEDEVVPAAALDVLAPLVCELAGLEAKAKPHLKLRKWLQLMLKASLLTGGVVKGVSVHDLVRDVMISRIDKAESSMVGLQRHVLRLMLAAHDESAADAPLTAFIQHALRHHIMHAKQPNVPLRDDELMMSALGNEVGNIRNKAVKGVGLDLLQEEIGACEEASRWYDAAQLCYAASAFHGSSGGAELKTAWAALKHVQPETEASLKLESSILGSLLFITKGGFAHGSAEHNEVMARMNVLGQLSGPAVDGSAAEAADFKTLLGLGFSEFFASLGTYGLAMYNPLTPESLAQTHAELKSSVGHLLESWACPGQDFSAVQMSHEMTVYLGFVFPMFHSLPGFDPEYFFGKGGAYALENLERFNNDPQTHLAHKSGQNGVPVDAHVMGHNYPALLLFFGAAHLEAGRAGLQKLARAWQMIEANCTSGEHKWNEYVYEEIVGGSFGVMLAAGELDLLRETLSRTFGGNAVRDAAVAAVFHSAYANDYPFMQWRSEEGHVYATAETLFLRARALTALVDDGPVDATALRAWLPTADELIHLARHEVFFMLSIHGAAHPALSCATLYATKLGQPEEAAKIAQALVEFPPLELQPLVCIEAWRLLARCRGDAAAKGEALARAIEAARAHAYQFMETLCAREKDYLDQHGELPSNSTVGGQSLWSK